MVGLLSILTQEWLCSFKRNTGAKGQRDYLWLTAFIGVWLTMVLMLFGTQNGLLNRFLSLSGGYVENAGTPVWTQAVLDNRAKKLDRAKLKFIDEKLRDFNEREHLSWRFHPFVSVKSVFVDWPGGTSQGALNGKQPPWQSEGSPLINLRAISTEDPMWPSGVRPSVSENGGMKPFLVLNRASFEKYFKCDIYIAKAKEFASKVYLKKYVNTDKRDTDGGLHCLDSGKILLSLSVGGTNKEVQPVDFHWVKNIYSGEEISGLMSFRFYNQMSFALNYPIFNYFPELPIGELNSRPKIIGFNDIDIEAKRENLLAFANCLEAFSKYDGSRTINHIYGRPIPALLTKDCSDEHGVSIKYRHKTGDRSKYDLRVLDAAPPSSFLEVTDSDVVVDCNLDTGIRTAQVVSVENDGERCRLNIADNDGGFTNAIIYVEREDLDKIDPFLNSLKDAEGEKILGIHWSYRNSLSRFGLINKIFETLETPYVFIVFIVALFFWGIITALIIQNRLHRFAIMMAKGAHAGWLHIGLLMQVAFSYAAGTLLSVAGLWLAKKYISSQTVDILRDKRFSDLVRTERLELIDISFAELAYVFTVFLLIQLGIAYILTLAFGINKKRELSTLFN